MPAIPLHTAGKYVAAAYVVFFAIVLIYVAIMAVRLARVERDLGELLTLEREREQDQRRELDAAGGEDGDQGAAAAAAPLQAQAAGRR